MGFEVFFSYNIEILLNKLLDDINDHLTLLNDPFYSARVLVPNMNVKKWLQISNAHFKGITVNIDFDFLESGLVSTFKDLDADFSSKLENSIFLSHKNNHIYMILMIISIIIGENYNDNLLPVYDYLKKSNQRDYIRKLWQFSNKLTGYFREYEYHREKMIDLWKKDKTFLQNNKIEKAQKYIYNQIFNNKKYKKAVKNKFNKDFTSLKQYIDNEAQKISELKPVGKNIFIFGFSQLSKFHYKLIFLLSRFYNIKFYQLNFFSFYCNECSFSDFIKNVNIEDQTIINANEMLNDLAKPFMEELVILNNAINHEKSVSIDFKFLNSNKNFKSNNILDLLKSSILSNNLNIKKLEKPDNSLNIIGNQGIYREIETVYNSILKNLSEDKSLKLSDIAILVTNMQKYKNTIKSIFSRNPMPINAGSGMENQGTFLPYNLSDSQASVDSVLGNALITGLKIIKGSFTRKEIFDFIMNPCFLESQKLLRQDVLTWLEWIDRLNIYNSFENESSITTDFTNWKTGLKRIRFGRLMSNYKFINNFKSFKSIIPYSDMESADQEKLNNFIFILQSLFDYLKSMSTKKTGTEWKKMLSGFIDKFLTVPEDIKEEQYILYTLIESFDKLDLLDSILSQKYDIVFIIEYIKSVLKNIPSKIGRYLTDGVTISSLMPMRPIPFKIIYLVGMNESDFPGNNDNSTLDLRNFKKEIGDTTLQESNAYLFLEVLLTVKEKLYITYVSKDIQKDEDLYPSNLCIKLINYINRNIVNNNFEIIQTPLDLSSRKFITDENLQKKGIRNYFFNEKLIGFLDMYNKNLLPEEYSKKTIDHYDQINESVSIPVNDDTLQIPSEYETDDLYKFIINPVQAKLNKLFEIYDNIIEDKLLKEDEPFYSNKLIESKIINDTINNFIKNRGLMNEKDISDYIDDFYSYNTHTGKTPSGDFGNIDKNNIMDKLINRIFNTEYSIKKYIEGFKDHNYYSIVIINSDYEPVEKNENEISIPSVTINLPGMETKSINITGKIDNLFINHEKKEAAIMVVTNSNKNYRYIIKPLIFYCLFLCSDNNITDENYTYAVNILHTDSIIKYEIRIEKHEAISYITDLLTDFINTENFNYLPFDIIINDKNIFPPENPDNFKNLLENSIEYEKEKSISFFREMQILDIINPEVPDNAFELIKKRYKFFDAMIRSEKKIG